MDRVQQQQHAAKERRGSHRRRGLNGLVSGKHGLQGLGTLTCTAKLGMKTAPMSILRDLVIKCLQLIFSPVCQNREIEYKSVGLMGRHLHG